MAVAEVLPVNVLVGWAAFDVLQDPELTPFDTVESARVKNKRRAEAKARAANNR